MRRTAPIVGWGLFYTALTALLTAPLLWHVRSVMPHDIGDPLLSTSVLWWNAHVRPLSVEWWRGFAFYPSSGMVAFSDHRLGASLIASPIQWAGGSAITAYNITLLSTFVLSALAGHWLGFVLTRRHDVGLICGLAYGFGPYRIAHIEHLELLASYAMPAALAALHLFAETRRPRWWVVFTLCLILQGLGASYYLLFFWVLVTVWVLWFVRWRDWRLGGAIAAAWVVCLATLWPIVSRYLQIHRHYGFGRVLKEVVAFSGDVTSYVTASPLLTLWGWTSTINGPERQLFPGLTITVLAVAGGVAAVMAARRTVRGSLRPSVLLVCAAGALVAIGVSAIVNGPWQLTAGPLSLSVGVPYKPLSLGVYALIFSIAALPVVRRAARDRSVLGFYLFATCFMVLCSLGPKPSFMGTQFMYQPPYAWLMRLPVFNNGVRAPARFAMLVALTLAVAGSLAFTRLTLRGGARWSVLALAVLGITADSWMTRLPLAALPAGWSPAQAQGYRAVLELPATDTLRDVAAMYRVSAHHVPVVNGYSGYLPSHYNVFKYALEERDRGLMETLALDGPILVATEDSADPDGSLRTWVQRFPGHPVGQDSGWSLYGLSRRSPAEDPSCAGPAVPVVAVSDEDGKVDAAPFNDGNPFTYWGTRLPQRIGDFLTLDLGEVKRPCELLLSTGPWSEGYPRAFVVDASADGTTWTKVFASRGAGLAFSAALENPPEVPIRARFASVPARYLRITLGEEHERFGWVVANAVVHVDR